MDHIGKFLHFFIGCLQIVNVKEVMEEDNLQLANLRRILEKLLDEICYVSMEKLGVFSMIDTKSSVTINQFLTCLQALILHCSYDLTNENVANITRLFEKHQTVINEAKKIQENTKKSMKRGKNQTEVSIAPGKKVELVFDCLWDLKACGNFLKIFFEPNVNEKINEIKQNSNLCRFVLKSTAENILHLSTAPDYLKFKHSKSSFTALVDSSAIIYKQIKLDAFEKLYSEFDEECAVAMSEAFKNSILTMDSIYNSAQKWQEFLQKVTGKGNMIDAMINDVIRQLQSIIEWAFDDENKKSDEENGVKVVANLFIAMETIFRNFQSLPNAYAREAYTWLLQFCQTHANINKNLQMINRILFQFMMQQDAGCTIAESTAHKIAATYTLLDETLQAPDDATQNELLSINSVTIDQTFFSFTAVVKKQIEDVEFCISRMNSFNAVLKIPGQPSHNENAEAMKVLEMSTVIKLASLGRIIGRLCNARFSAHGAHIETIGRVVTNYFICLGNLMKHFNQHFEVKKLDYQFIPLEMLLKEVKGTVLKAYALSPYIEELYEQEQKKAAKANAGKKKKVVVIKELKYSSRLVGAAEKLTTIVQRFDKLASRNFSKYMYSGEVRDFRISEGNTLHEESSEDEIVEQASENEAVSESNESEPSSAVPKKRLKRLVLSSDETNSESEDSPIAPQPLRADGFAKNLKKIVKRAKEKAATAKTRKRK